MDECSLSTKVGNTSAGCGLEVRDFLVFIDFSDLPALSTEDEKLVFYQWTSNRERSDRSLVGNQAVLIRTRERGIEVVMPDKSLPGQSHDELAVTCLGDEFFRREAS
jgi:hypothetical protein